MIGVGLAIAAKKFRAAEDSGEDIINSLAEQAKNIRHRLNSDKPTVTIKTEQHNMHLHFDLTGPDHKGVKTPHAQFSIGNTDREGETRYKKQKKLKDTREMTQQDIRTVRRYLERKNR